MSFTLGGHRHAGRRTTRFVEFTRAILFRGAGLEVVWKQFVSLGLIGVVLFFLSLARFRQTLGTMA